MPAKFLESFGSKLAEKWVATLLTPSFIFWAGGAAIVLQRFGWKYVITWFSQQPEPLQISFLVGGFCLIAASAFVVQRFDLQVLRFLEGYWFNWLSPLRRWFIALEAGQRKKIEDRWQELKLIAPDKFTTGQRDELIQLDWQQHYLPISDQLMPTRVGNILRAAERRPLDKYGLDAIICWSRLWLLLPDAVKNELQEVRSDLNTSVRIWLWSLLFTVWTIWEWWAAPAGLLCAFFAYYSWALDAARSYGELIDATFDTQRHLLYQSLRFQLPTDPEEERISGRKLTEYLWRGL
jgi:hypothetical protein